MSLRSTDNKYKSKHEDFEELIIAVTSKMKMQKNRMNRQNSFSRTQTFASLVSSYQQYARAERNPFIIMKEQEELDPDDLDGDATDMKDFNIFKIAQGTDKTKKIEKNIMRDKQYHIEMDTFYSNISPVLRNSINKHRLLNLKVAPMFLDNQITLCL